MLRAGDFRDPDQKVRLRFAQVDAPVSRLRRYARTFQKVAKKWKSYGFTFLDVRDPVAQLLKLECKEPF